MQMGIYYGDVLGVRLVRRIHEDAEYSEDYEVVWEYEGPYWRELTAAKCTELADPDLIVQTKHETTCTYERVCAENTTKMYIWLTNLESLQA
jgi:hypothetical protein